MAVGGAEATWHWDWTWVGREGEVEHGLWSGKGVMFLRVIDRGESCQFSDFPFGI